ncbi:MAG: hypothetical protein CMO55_07470 [Verrucomicrobiales bacterium]|nr:hypothetical protein [Verrucomicrobiales bacterium]
MKRFTPGPFFDRWQRGSVLVLSMVLAALGTIGVAAWISLLDARSHQVEQNFEAIKRRVVYNNSRALAYRAMYANYLHASQGLASDTTFSLPSGNGEATIRAFSPVPLSNESSVRNSCNGAVPFRSFSTDVTVDLTDGVGSYSWQYQLRNYNPVLGGELLSIHPPVDYDASDSLTSGSITVKGRAAFWDAAAKDLAPGLRADQFLLPNDIVNSTTFSNSSGASVLPLNYPIPLQTTGFVSTTPAYQGQLDITSSAGNSHNANATRLTATGNSFSLKGTTADARGPGPSTQADGPDDATLEIAVATQDTATLMTTLPSYYPLSSRILQAVAAKTSPTPFTEDEIYTIFSDHIPIPNDALTALTGTHQARIGSRTDELHQANGTWVSSDGNGVVRVFLEESDLPHLILDETSELQLFGQADNSAASAAAALDPIGIVVANSSGFGLNAVSLKEQNLRRLFLSISTEPIPTPSPGTYTYFPSFVFSGSLPFPKWAVIMDLQNTGARIDSSPVAGVTLVGGIRANRKVEVTSGTLTIERQYNFTNYETLLSRNAWIEAYRQ